MVTYVTPVIFMVIQSCDLIKYHEIKKNLVSTLEY